jgi:hypothetical protein
MRNTAHVQQGNKGTLFTRVMIVSGKLSRYATDGVESAAPVHRERRSSTPGSTGSSSFAIGDSLEGEVLRLMQANTSALSVETTSKAALESQRLSMEIERDTRQRELDRATVEVEKRPAKTEEDREARLQRRKNEKPN